MSTKVPLTADKWKTIFIATTVSLSVGIIVLVIVVVIYAIKRKFSIKGLSFM